MAPEQTSAPVGHTAGPWQLTVDSEYVRVTGADGTGLFFESLHQPGALEDGRLIAAAPELLEALEALDALWAESEAHGVDFTHAIAQARAAIAKATGAQS